MAVLTLVGLAVTYMAARALRAVRTVDFCSGVARNRRRSRGHLSQLGLPHGVPHVHYLASVGASLLWAALPAALLGASAELRARRLVSIALGTVVTVLMLWSPVTYVRCHLDLTTRPLVSCEWLPHRRPWPLQTAILSSSICRSSSRPMPNTQTVARLRIHSSAAASASSW